MTSYLTREGYIINHEKVVIRSDNVSQFITKKVREYLGLIGVQQEFTHIATPKENAHIKPIMAYKTKSLSRV